MAENQALPDEMLTNKTCIIHSGQFMAGGKITDFPYPFIYLNSSNPYLFVYLKPEKGTHLGWGLTL